MSDDKYQPSPRCFFSSSPATMLPGKVATPLFSRGSVIRRSSEMTVGSGKNQSAKTKPTMEARNLDDANLRIVQYVISEREACKVIGEMCQEASIRLEIVDTEYKIDDILSGILILGNLYKRVGNEKGRLESIIESQKEDYKTLETSKDAMIERLENAILRLQQENDKLQDTITEMKMKHDYQMINAMKEIHEHKEAMEAMRGEKATLQTRITQQERKLMEVPRMEEQYQRNARGIVRQQEVANTLKEIGWKKLEEEVKSLNFWKSKAKVLEEGLSRVKVDLENMTNHNRVSLSRYQTLLVSYNAMKRNNPHADVTMRAVLTGTGTGGSFGRPSTAGATRGGDFGGTGGSSFGGMGGASGRAPSPTAFGGTGSAPLASTSSSGKQRPISAPPGRTPTNNTSNTNTNTTISTNMSSMSMKASAMPEMVDIPSENDAPYMQDTALNTTLNATNHRLNSTQNSRRTTSTPKSTNVFKRTLHNITSDELDKLREIIITKDEIITRLSRKLSHTRAYPLKGMHYTPEDNYSDDEAPAMNSNQANKSSKLGPNATLSQKIGMTFDEDCESESESFMAEEEARHQRRVSLAVELQHMKNERSARTKAANPPHIRAIREAKSFAESVTDKFNIPR